MSRNEEEQFAITSRFYATLNSLQQFNNVELKTTILEIPIDDRADSRQKCVIATYYRIRSNVESMLTLTRRRDVQAIAMLARTVLELAIDLRLMNRVGQSPERMIAFADTERLRAARNLTEFKHLNPESQLDVIIQDNFVRDRGTEIDATTARLWPHAGRLRHWSGMNLAQRANEVGTPFPDLYHRAHTLLSWYVHSGLMGVMNLPADTFTTVAGHAFAVAVEAYDNCLDFIIREFPFRFESRFLNLLAYAKRAPWPENEDEATALRRELGIE